MPENVKLHPHENCNCDRDGVALPPEIVLEVKNLTKKFQAAGNTMFYKAAVCRSLPEKQSV